ncbi:Transcriptional regulator MNL1 [Orchesella cincta]|uniref:Transcriptional regulator MNL1 n=1 Tax=Orchesella cincta TaxID=48709 RepID=A0A1D2ME20_ORCCI|nr:Transcriptional regulator MNL1 [Orchesella cincta]
MSSDGLVEMDGDSNSKISIMDVIVWYRCGTCHGYFHSIPILRYHYLVDHKSSMPRINGQLPPGALKGKIYTRHKPPPPPIRNVEPTSAPIPLTNSSQPLEEIVVDVACIQPAENPVPSPSDSGIHDGESETHEEELQPPAQNIVPATPPRQNVVSPLLLKLTDKTDNVTSKEKTATPTNTQHDVAQESSSKCTICQKKFQTLSALNFHLKKRHMYQVVSGSSENNHAETSPPKLILKMTKNGATATTASSTAPIETTTNSANCIVAGRRRSSRLMSSESCSTPPHSGDAGSPSALNMEGLTEPDGGESNMDSVNTESRNQTEVSVGDIADTGSPNDSSKDDAEVNCLSDSSTSTVVRPKKKINGSIVSASSDSSNWDIEKGPTKKKKLLITSDSEQSKYESALSSPPRSPQTSYAVEENRDKDDTAQREVEPDNVLTKTGENNAIHTGDKQADSPNVETEKKRQSQPTEGLQNSSNTNEDQSNRKRKRRCGKASGQINKDDSTSDSGDDKKPSRSRKIKRKKKLVSRSQISSSSESEEEREKETAMHLGHDDVQNEPFSPCPPALSCYGGSDNEVPEPSVISKLKKKKAISSHDSSSSSDLFIELEVKKKKKKTKPLHVCQHCHVECQNSSDLVHHLKKAHNENPKFRCGFCQKPYSRRDMINKHLRLHKNGKI